VSVDRARKDAAEAELRRTFDDGALERLERSEQEYYSKHGHYVPALARLLLIERRRLDVLVSELEAAHEELTTANGTSELLASHLAATAEKLQTAEAELEAAQKGFSPSVRKAFDEQRELWQRKLADARAAAAEEHTRELLKALAWFADETNYESDGPALDSPVQAFGLEAARAAVSGVAAPTEKEER
jgi:hypothetical protein